MKSYKHWKNEATSQPVTQDQPMADDTQPNEDDKLFYRGQYSGVVGPLLTRLSGVVLTDSRFNRPAIKGLLLQDIILALGLNQDIGMFTRIANRIRTELNAAENPATLPFASPALKKALEKKGITPQDMNQDRKRQAMAPPPPPAPEQPKPV